MRAVNIIPGSTEFGYDTAVVTREVGGGATEAENAHAAAQPPTGRVSLDELEALCPNLGAASLVVAWFGDRICAAADCRI